MFAKMAMVACALAVANAGLISGPAAYTSFAAPSFGPAVASYAAPAELTATSENVYRSPGNLQTISSHSKSIATPFSSSNKHFTSVTNPGVYATHYPVAHYTSPVVHAAPAPSLLGVAYSPSVAVSHMTYSAPAFGVSYAY